MSSDQHHLQQRGRRPADNVPARRRAGSTYERDQFGSPNFQPDQRPDLARLLLLAQTDVTRAAAICQRSYRVRQNAVRKVRYEDAALAVGIYYDCQQDERYLDTLKDVYESTFHRELNPKKLLRECCVVVYGEERKGAAGTDATALENAVHRRVPPLQIPRLIKEQHGLEEMRRKLSQRSKRSRDEGPELRAKVRADDLTRFEEMPFDRWMPCEIRKVRDRETRKAQYLITNRRPRAG